MTVTRENTEKLTLLHQLTSKERMLEEKLNTRQKSIVSVTALVPPHNTHLHPLQGMDISGSGQLLEPEEKARLLQIVRLQNREIESLKEEIRLLSCKGGHVLPPSQPPRPAAPVHLQQ